MAMEIIHQYRGVDIASDPEAGVWRLTIVDCRLLISKAGQIEVAMSGNVDDPEIGQRFRLETSLRCREGARKSVKVRWIAVAAAVVLVAAFAVWAWLGGRGPHQAKNEKIVAQNTRSYKDHLIDFRYQAPVRGPEQNANKSPDTADLCC
jgi:hypothetical protein